MEALIAAGQAGITVNFQQATAIAPASCAARGCAATAVRVSGGCRRPRNTMNES